MSRRELSRRELIRKLVALAAGPGGPAAETEAQQLIDQLLGAKIFIAEYEGREPALFTSEDQALFWCDEWLRTESGDNIKPHDWIPTEGGQGMTQVWINDLDDNPLSNAHGYVTPVVLDAEVGDE